MGKIFKTQHFTRWMQKTNLTDELLCIAICEMARGLIDADLGGGVVKKRIALPGRGKRSSARTLIATNKKDRWFFVFGFEKNERSNISRAELKALQQLATDLLNLTSQEINVALKNNSLEEICHDNPN
ncbi:type II toxin-antitoxin system RelE/ParE family toxin [Crenothrix polyspora]|uniref:Type II toxin-antitoxin system RelE/ParE family toxin n=1 Tax=Crenothrix polyspora TaxID=360316 RepID=A0A1R4HA28_9GAMM|nr:type II toxin-antitoxin system RelE/ParE family toxin [Crenothrix polyspora]SJM92710.1 conserved hypothetical protein [Crenothrix polyspora]